MNKSEDQAASLRQSGLQGANSRKAVHCLTVASGKGGVGKTFFTVNLAIAFSQLNKKVLLVDADLGLANADILLGITPKLSLLDCMMQSTPLADVVLHTESGVDLLPASSGGVELLNVGEARMKLFIDELLSFAAGYDVLLFDCAAGIDSSVTAFIGAAPHTLILTTPQPTALMDAYALMKVIKRDNLSDKVSLVLNQTASAEQGSSVFNKLEIMSENYLKLDLEYCGSVANSKHVLNALRRKKPLLELFPEDPAAIDIKNIAMRLLKRQKGSVRLRNLNAQGLLDGILKKN